ncbi:MAG: hypothetical protein WD045_13215 [Pirellulaceae bacterium]
MKQTWMVALIVTISAMVWTADCSAGFPRPFRWVGEGWSDGYHTPGERWNQPPKQARAVPFPPIHIYPLNAQPWSEVPSGEVLPLGEGELIVPRAEALEEPIPPGSDMQRVPREQFEPNPAPRPRGFLPPF